MNAHLGQIFIEDMEFFAFHGHYDEEKFAGNRFTASIYLWTDTSKAEKSDNLDDALNYQVVYAIISDIMKNKVEPCRKPCFKHSKCNIPTLSAIAKSQN